MVLNWAMEEHKNTNSKAVIDEHELQKLEWNSMLLSALVDHMPDQIYFKDKDSRFIRINQAQAQHLHIDHPDDAIGKTDFDFFSNEHAREAFADEQLIVEKGIVVSKEEEETWRDRPNTWVSTTKAPLFDKSGNVIGTLGISRDITQKKQIEYQLIASEERFRTIIENMGEGIGIVDDRENFVFTNPAADEIFGLPKGELVGRNLREFIDEKYHEEITRQTGLRKTGGKSIYELEIKRPSGEKRLLLVTTAPKLDGEGLFAGTYGVFRDITLRKQHEQIIQKQNQELREVNSQKDKLFSIIAHDLRSPFNSFLGLTETLENQVGQISMEDIKALATAMRQSAVKIYNLLSNLLEWSRIQRNMIKLSPQHFLINHVVQVCTEALEDKALAKSIKVINMIPDDYEIIADPYMLQVIVQNLLSNAIKFTNIFGQVTIRAEKSENGTTEISVSDNGIGMSEEILKCLFQIDAKNGRPGTNNESSIGLGLLLCKEFVELHGGRIWATSKIGKGTTFTFTLEKENNVSDVNQQEQ